MQDGEDLRGSFGEQRLGQLFHPRRRRLATETLDLAPQERSPVGRGQHGRQPPSATFQRFGQHAGYGARVCPPGAGSLAVAKTTHQLLARPAGILEIFGRSRLPDHGGGDQRPAKSLLTSP